MKFIPLLAACLVSANAFAGTIHVKVIQSSGEFFPEGQGPTISWGKKHGEAKYSDMGSKGPDQREFDVELPEGTWHFGTSPVDGYGTISYDLSGNGGYRDVAPGGFPVEVPASGALGLTISYLKNQDAGLPANHRLQCEYVKDYIPPTDEQELIGSSGGVRIGVTRDFGAIGVKLELINADRTGERLQIVDARSAAGAAWQATLGYQKTDGSMKYAPNQVAGNWLGQFGFAATMNDLRQVDWSPMWTDHLDFYQPSAPSQANTPCFGIGHRHFDGQFSRIMDYVTTPAGGKVVRTTFTSRYRSRAAQQFKAWESEQALYMTRTAAVQGNLRAYFMGPAREWASKELPTTSNEWFSKEDGHCNEYVKNDNSWDSLRSGCRPAGVSYVVLRWNVGSKDLAMAIVRDGGAPFMAELDQARALTCKNAEDPKCGNLELHNMLSYHDEEGVSEGWHERVRSFSKNQEFEDKVHYLVGSPQELADLGFIYGGGPRPKHGRLFVPGSAESGTGDGAGWKPERTMRGEIRGIVDGLSRNPLSVDGWACAYGIDEPIGVHLYSGGPVGIGRFVGGVTTDVASGPDIARACGAKGTAYHFHIPITDSALAESGGQSVWVHGLSPVGKDNSLLSKSGEFRLPGTGSDPLPQPDPEKNRDGDSGARNPELKDSGWLQVEGDGAIYYYRGAHYCKKQAWDDFVNSGGRMEDVTKLKKLSGMTFDGDCAFVAQPEGFFQIPGDGAIYYSNGKDAFCKYPHWENYLRAGGKADLSNVKKMSDPRLPPAMRNDGDCKE